MLLKGHGQRSYRTDLDTSFHVLKKKVHRGFFQNEPSEICFNLLSVSLMGKFRKKKNTEKIEADF